MRFTEKNNTYFLEKKEGILDTFTWSFLNELTKFPIQHVLISGYVAILFGRNRSSEDIDILIPQISKETFDDVWKQLLIKYDCLNTTNKEEAYYDYLETGHALRFAIKGESIPNMEVKFPKTSIEKWVLKNKKKIIVNKNTIYISPIEIQIAYKLYLGSEKDLEDALFLKEFFKEKLNKEELHHYLQELKVQDIYEEHLQ